MFVKCCISAGEGMSAWCENMGGTRNLGVVSTARDEFGALGERCRGSV